MRPMDSPCSIAAGDRGMVLHHAPLRVEVGRDPAAPCRPYPRSSARRSAWPVRGARHPRRVGLQRDLDRAEIQGPPSTTTLTPVVPRANVSGRTSLTAATPPPRAPCEAARAPPATARPHRTRSARPRARPTPSRLRHQSWRSARRSPPSSSYSSTAQKPRQATASSHSRALKHPQKSEEPEKRWSGGEHERYLAADKCPRGRRDP
jgi:hypothetical protein